MKSPLAICALLVSTFGIAHADDPMPAEETPPIAAEPATIDPAPVVAPEPAPVVAPGPAPVEAPAPVEKKPTVKARISSTGVTAVIDAKGRVRQSLPLGAEGWFDSDVPPALPPTLYARTGDLPATIALAVAILALGLTRRRQSH